MRLAVLLAGLILAVPVDAAPRRNALAALSIDVRRFEPLSSPFGSAS